MIPSPEYNPNQKLIFCHDLGELIENFRIPICEIKEDSFNEPEGYSMRSLIFFISNNLTNIFIISRPIGEDYIQHLAKISNNTTDNIKQRIVIKNIKELTKEVIAGYDGTFVPYIYSEKYNNSSSNNIELSNKKNIVVDMNSKFFSKKIWQKNKMTTQGYIINLEKTREDIIEKVKEKSKNIHSLGFGTAIKTDLSFSGEGIECFHYNEERSKQWKIIESFFDNNIANRKEIVKEILLEPLLPISSKNITSVQIFRNKESIDAYKTTYQITHGTTYIGNSLSIELTDPTLSSRLKEIAVEYYQSLEKAIQEKHNSIYFGDSAIDIGLIDRNDITKEQLLGLGISDQYVKEVQDSTGKSYFVYILENNSRYGGATYISKTENYMRSQNMLDKDSFLNVQNFLIPINSKFSSAKDNKTEQENDLIKQLRDLNMLHTQENGCGIITLHIISQTGTENKITITFSDDLKHSILKKIQLRLRGSKNN